MLWNPNPILLDLGPLQLHWYGLLFAGGFLVGYKIMQWIYVREGRQRAELDSLLLHVMVGTVVGARLVHCLFYDPQYFLARPLEIFMIWRGGLASHGGAIGLLLAVMWYCRGVNRPHLLWLLDRLCIPATLAGGFIRVGNFFNSEIIGKVTDSALGVIFSRADPHLLPRHPVQLYEACAYFVIFAGLLWLYARTRAAQSPGLLTGTYFLAVFAARFAIEFYKSPQASYESGFAISVGQWLSLPFIAVGLGMILWTSKDGARR